MSRYEPPAFDSPIELDLSRNEGRPAIEGLSLEPGAIGRLVRRYPDTSALASRLAARHGVGDDGVLVTAGGDDGIFRCMLWARGLAATTTTPTFEMIARYADQVGAQLSEIPWWEGPLPVEDLVDTGADVAFIVSPNNPTGSVIEERELLSLADRFRYVVLDAAYVEFARADLTPTALERGNVVVVRTLSKAFGLAGLRVGCLLGPPVLISEIRSYGSPYAVSGISSALATRALGHSIEDYVSAVVKEREQLTTLLTESGVAPMRSEANFVLATNTEPDRLVTQASSRGVGLRSFPGRPGLERCVRIGLPGDTGEFHRLVAMLETVLAPGRKREVESVS